jgi:hypothetical protein
MRATRMRAGLRVADAGAAGGLERGPQPAVVALAPPRVLPQPAAAAAAAAAAANSAAAARGGGGGEGLERGRRAALQRGGRAPARAGGGGTWGPPLPVSSPRLFPPLPVSSRPQPACQPASLPACRLPVPASTHPPLFGGEKRLHAPANRAPTA